MKRYIPCYIFLLTLLAFACKKIDVTPDDRVSGIRTIGDFIHNNYDLSLFSAALQKTGLLDSLNTDGPFTVWAPDNKAYNALGINKPEDFNRMNTDSLRIALKNLMFSDRLYTSVIPTQLDNRYTCLGGMLSYVSVGTIGANADAFPTAFNGSIVYEPGKRNLAMKNGVVHVLKAVPKYTEKNTQEILAADTTLSIFVALLKKTNQWDALKTEGPFTVYAPVNEAFRNCQLTPDSIARIDLSRYKPLAFSVYTLRLQPHHILMNDLWVIGATSARVDLGDGYTLNPGSTFNVYAPGEKWNYHSPNNGINIADGAKGQDIMTTNGVVNRLNNILLYPDSLLIQ
ncbi:fasciclin domain-containing protein [Chitinophaga qingshengii]|uniref:Fasciclin domain-containing protein n=1 Tax=Chitinophaga qingshengii TaxID=1569794 RepID=A0ABR7TH24_9BACT|nr:fasciclin domain-containing protein [Chitinophaga qingshengii]MBC9929783.1 fasciclin domain-containing protein [Chitinophaga qingshengii]